MNNEPYPGPGPRIQLAHHEDLICPFRGAFVAIANGEAGWSDEHCAGPRCAKWVSLQNAPPGSSAAGFCTHGTQALPQLMRCNPPRTSTS